MPIINMMATIYGLRCNETGEVYIGSTTDLKRRINEHKSHNSCSSKQIIDRNNYEFYVIEETDIENRFIRERYYIESTKCINIMFPLRTFKEYYESHREEIIQHSKEYYESHREEIKQIKKEYYESHKEQIKQKDKKYYESNREEIKQKASEVIECECGTKITKRNLATHKKTLKHLNQIKTKELC